MKRQKQKMRAMKRDATQLSMGSSVQAGETQTQQETDADAVIIGGRGPERTEK